MTDIPDKVQRLTARRKAAVVLSVVKGETSAAEAARKHGLTVAEIECWQEQFFAAGENAMRARPKDEEAAKDEQIERLQRKVGELVLDIDILEGGEQGPPFRSGDVRRVRAALPGPPNAASAASSACPARACAKCPPRSACGVPST